MLSPNEFSTSAGDDIECSVDERCEALVDVCAVLCGCFKIGPAEVFGVLPCSLSVDKATNDYVYLRGDEDSLRGVLAIAVNLLNPLGNVGERLRISAIKDTGEREPDTLANNTRVNQPSTVAHKRTPFVPR